MNEYIDALKAIADQIEQRERDTNSPSTDGPSADDIRSLIGALDLIQDGDVTPGELWGIIQLFCDTSDKWLFPEEDPMGKVLCPVLEEIIRNLDETLNKYVPGMEAQKECYFNLRSTAHCAKHAAILRERNPSTLDRFFSKLGLGIDFEPSTFFRTLLATMLYQSGKALTRVGKFLGATGKISTNSRD